jgi:hypothetical protein
MECTRFVEEKIGETDSAEFREHRAGCAGCRRDLEELREVRTLYREASTESYRAGVPRLRRTRVSWVPMAAAAAVLIGVFVLILGGPRPEDVKPTDPGTAPGIFVRVPLQPWASDASFTRTLDDCWRQLERLEENR